MSRGWSGDSAAHAAAARLGWARRRGSHPGPGARTERKSTGRRGRPRGPIKTFGPLFETRKVGRRSKSHPAGRYETVRIGGEDYNPRRKHMYSRPIGPEPAPAGYVAPRRRGGGRKKK